MVVLTALASCTGCKDDTSSSSSHSAAGAGGAKAEQETSEAGTPHTSHENGAGGAAAGGPSDSGHAAGSKSDEGGSSAGGGGGDQPQAGADAVETESGGTAGGGEGGTAGAHADASGGAPTSSAGNGSAGEAGAGTPVFAGVVVGGNNMCALMPDDTVSCAGYNVEGQLGIGTRTNTTTLTPVVGLSDVSILAASGVVSCAVLSDQTAECWGDNSVGGLGVGNITGPEACPSPNACSTKPVPVLGLSGVRSLGMGSNHTCAVLMDGTVYCWGMNDHGQLGNGTVDGPETSTGGAVCNPTPGPVTNLDGATALAAGRLHTCALLTDQTAACWGANYSGQLGNDSTADSATPVPVSNLTGVKAIVCGDTHTCALLTDDSVQCWGAAGNGRLGIDTTDNALTPVAVPGLSDAKAISCGTGFQAQTTCVLLADKTVRCWGLNNGGQLGDGTKNNSPTPVPVPGLTDVTAISEGMNGGCALRADHTLWCWGSTGLTGQPWLTPTLVTAELVTL